MVTGLRRGEREAHHEFEHPLVGGPDVPRPVSAVGAGHPLGGRPRTGAADHRRVRLPGRAVGVPARGGSGGPGVGRGGDRPPGQFGRVGRRPQKSVAHLPRSGDGRHPRPPDRPAGRRPSAERARLRADRRPLVGGVRRRLRAGTHPPPGGGSPHVAGPVPGRVRQVPPPDRPAQPVRRRPRATAPTSFAAPVVGGQDGLATVLPGEGEARVRRRFRLPPRVQRPARRGTVRRTGRARGHPLGRRGRRDEGHRERHSPLHPVRRVRVLRPVQREAGGPGRSTP